MALFLSFLSYLSPKQTKTLNQAILSGVRKPQDHVANLTEAYLKLLVSLLRMVPSSNTFFMQGYPSP